MDLITTAQAARKAGLSQATILRASKRGILTEQQPPEAWGKLWELSEVDAWIASRTRKPYTRKTPTTENGETNGLRP